MNILMFGWEFPPNISGGLGTACHGIVRGLQTCGDVHVTFVVPKAFGDEDSANTQIISAENIALNAESFSSCKSGDVSFLKVTSKLTPYLTPEIYCQRHQITGEQGNISGINSEHKTIHFSGKYGPDLFDEISNYAIVARTIASHNDFNLIHAHDWLTFPAAVAAKQISGKPLIVHIHSTDFDRSGGSVNPAIYTIEKQGMDAADQVITVSNRIKNRLIAEYNISPSKITTVYNAIEPETQDTNGLDKRKSKRRTVTFLGRITIQKGPEYFVEVARMILLRMKHVRFVMAGSGELKEKIIDLCARYGISDKFHFPGFLKGKEVSQMLQQSDLFIMPSVSEPFGIVPLEAMQANVPIIISLQSGVSEVIQNAVKTDFWDVQAMADAVHGILTHKKLAKTMTDKGKQEVSKLNWESSARQIRQVYLNTLSNAAS